MPKKTFYIGKSKPPLESFAIFFSKPPGKKWNIIAKLEIAPKIVAQYNRKISAKQIYGIVGKEFGVGKWNI
jgi:hypothetical protein